MGLELITMPAGINHRCKQAKFKLKKKKEGKERLVRLLIGVERKTSPLKHTTNDARL
jgi:hypothetical protein